MPKKTDQPFLLQYFVLPKKIEEMENILFIHTTTIGIRRHMLERTTLPRQIKTLSTPYGNALVKKVQHGEKIYYYPEFESVKELAEQNHMDFKTIYHAILCSAKENNV